MNYHPLLVHLEVSSLLDDFDVQMGTISFSLELLNTLKTGKRMVGTISIAQLHLQQRENSSVYIKLTSFPVQRMSVSNYILKPRR